MLHSLTPFWPKLLKTGESGFLQEGPSARSRYMVSRVEHLFFSMGEM